MGSDAISGVQHARNVVRNSTYAQVQSDNTKPPRRESAGGTPGRGDQIALGSGASRQSLDTLQRLGDITDASNATASAIRETGNGLQSSADIVTRMEGELGRIIKNYPPFLIEDGGRKEILMRYSSLRKEIEQLTVPPPPPPVYEKVEGMWDDLFSVNGGKIATPVLEQDAPDKTVQAAARQLAATGNAISRLISSVATSL